MGRLSEYNESDQQRLRNLPEPQIVIGTPPRELRWDDLTEKEKRFWAFAFVFILSAPFDNEQPESNRNDKQG